MEKSTDGDYPDQHEVLHQDTDSSKWSPPRKGAARPTMASSVSASSFNDGTLHTRNLLLRGVAAIYLMAFIGFYHQSPGNWWKNGLGNTTKMRVLVGLWKPNIVCVLSMCEMYVKRKWHSTCVYDKETNMIYGWVEGHPRNVCSCYVAQSMDF